MPVPAYRRVSAVQLWIACAKIIVLNSELRDVILNQLIAELNGATLGYSG
jgi:hypothetical protein